MSEIIGTDQNFQAEVLEEKDRPVLVDFWATWCTPCKIQDPILDELAKELGDKAKVVKMEVDENPATPGQYNILSIPTLAIFKNGEMVWQGVGVHQKQALQAEITKHV
jgi:thioredoxin 1